MRQRRTSAKTAEVDLTPMLDVVFILLIFFIVTAVFLQEKAIGLEPPPPQNSAICDCVPPIIVEINEEGRVRVNGRVSLVASVRANIERIRAEMPASPVIIQAHPDARNSQIIRVRDQIASAHVRSVNLVLSDV